MCTLQEDAYSIVREAIEQNLPGPAVRKALVGYRPPRGRRVVVALGKAAWTMAQAASESLGDAIGNGIVITKYHHVLGPIDRFECFEAGHPVVDEASVRATRRAQELVRDLGADDAVVLLVSGVAARSSRIPRYRLTSSRTYLDSCLPVARP